MRSFSEYNPIVIAVWFLSVTGIAMFCNYPLLMVISLVGAVAFFVMRNGLSHGKTHIFFWVLFLILALANPLVSHNGKTVLFVMNHNPVTLEATLYGLNSAAMIIGVLYWLRSFTQIMTSEKLLYITGALSPKLSLVLSMALRFVPLFGRQSAKINAAQTAMAVMVTWALENGIITADSMEARGFGTGRRTQMRRFRFAAADIAFLIATLGLFGITCAAVGAKSLSFEFYPSITAKAPDMLGVLGLISYGLMILMPMILELVVSLKWKYLRSAV